MVSGPILQPRECVLAAGGARGEVCAPWFGRSVPGKVRAIDQAFEFPREETTHGFDPAPVASPACDLSSASPRLACLREGEQRSCARAAERGCPQGGRVTLLGQSARLLR